MKPPNDPRRAKAIGRFLMVRLNVRESAAWIELPANARLFLEALELVAMKASFPESGELVATYNHLVAYGLRRSSIHQAVLEAEALGFVVIVRKGFRGPADVRVPSVYRLTYISGPVSFPLPTDEWRKHKSRHAARRAVREVKELLEKEREHRLARRRGSDSHRGVA